MPSIFTSEGRAAAKLRKDAVKQAEQLRRQQATCSTQRKPSLSAPNANSLSRRFTGITVDSIFKHMKYRVKKKGLNSRFFYTPRSVGILAGQLFQDGAPQLIKQAWNLTDDEASEMGILGLWDVWLLCDDSRSMMEKYNPGREKALKDYVTRMAKAGTLFDADGISVDFFHSPGADFVTTEAEVTQVFSKMENKSGTPIGLTLENKILSKIRNEIFAKRLQKPVLILILTGGAPSGDGPYRNLHGKPAEDYIIKVISDMVQFLRDNAYSAEAVKYMFAQVGDDPGAQKFLGRMDNAPGIEKVVDATSSYEAESAEVQGQLTVAGYLLKLLLGAISPKRDAVDNQSNNSRRGNRATSKSRT